MSAEIDIDFLYRAIETNARIAVHYKNDQEKTLEYHSRFFKFDKKKKHIIIDKPSGEKGVYQQLAPSDKITLYFRSAGFRFIAHSTILKRGTYKLQGDHKIPVLSVSLPAEIEDGERRNFFRVPLPTKIPTACKFISYFDVQHDLQEQQELQKLEVLDMSEATVLDVSNGGIAIKCDKNNALLVGDIIIMRFTLPLDIVEDIEISGVINNSRVVDKGEAVIKGIEFIPDGGDAYKMAIKLISRYVMRRQREMLKAYRR